MLATPLNASVRRTSGEDRNVSGGTPVALDSLLRGSWYALDQAGRLLREAVALEDSGAHSTAGGLALLAREELGRYAILRELWGRALQGGAVPTPAEVRAACENHVVKQQRGAFSSVMQAQGDSRLATLMRRLLKLPYHSQDAQLARAEVEAARRAKDKRTPTDRHTQRMRAFYVDLAENGRTWHRPAELDPAETRNWIFDAINDYSVLRDRLTTPGVREFAEPEFAAALDTWPDRPPLPPPVWPQMHAPSEASGK
jgi:AbiV family abortive infection protein